MYMPVPEENRTGGHCHNMGNCGGNEKLIHLCRVECALPACLAGDNVNTVLCCK